MMKLVEEVAGRGTLGRAGEPLRDVDYEVSRYQDVMEGSGMPIPGRHRIEGRVSDPTDGDFDALVGGTLQLTMADGRTLGVTLVDGNGRILSEGHGPMKCLCC